MPPSSLRSSGERMHRVATQSVTTPPVAATARSLRAYTPCSAPTASDLLVRWTQGQAEPGGVVPKRRNEDAAVRRPAAQGGAAPAAAPEYPHRAG